MFFTFGGQEIWKAPYDDLPAATGFEKEYLANHTIIWLIEIAALIIGVVEDVCLWSFRKRIGPLVGKKQITLEPYNLRPVQVPYDRSNGDSIEIAFEKVLLNVGEQVLNRKPEFDDFKEFTHFKNEEEHVVGSLRHWGITYRGSTIRFVVFDNTYASSVSRDHLAARTILLN